MVWCCDWLISPSRFCAAILESTSIGDLYRLEEIKKHHADLMESYRNQQWEDCQRCIAVLTGAFKGELDSFYEDIRSRVNRLQTLPLDDTWTPVIPKT